MRYIRSRFSRSVFVISAACARSRARRLPAVSGIAGAVDAANSNRQEQRGASRRRRRQKQSAKLKPVVVTATRIGSRSARSARRSRVVEAADPGAEDRARRNVLRAGARRAGHAERIARHRDRRFDSRRDRVADAGADRRSRSQHRRHRRVRYRESDHRQSRSRSRFCAARADRSMARRRSAAWSTCCRRRARARRTASLLSEGGNRATQRAGATSAAPEGKLGFSGALSYFSTEGFRPVNDNSDNLAVNRAARLPPRATTR